MNLRPGSPQGRAPAAPRGGQDLDESIGGNMDLGSQKKSKRGSTRSMRWGLRGSQRHSRQASMAGRKAGAKEGDDDDDEDDFEEARFGGRNAIPDDETE